MVETEEGKDLSSESAKPAQRCLHGFHKGIESRKVLQMDVPLFDLLPDQARAGLADGLSGWS